MSAALYISFESPTSAENVVVDGKYIMPHLDNISAIGEDHNLKRLDEYVSQSLSEILEFIDESVIPKQKVEETHNERWFDSNEGLEVIGKYKEVVKTYHSLSNTTKEDCLRDLESYEEVLKVLAKENIRWHFSYDI